MIFLTKPRWIYFIGKEVGTDDSINAVLTETPESGRVPPSYGCSSPTVSVK